MFGRDNDIDETVVQCKQCGEKHKKAKPGLQSTAMLNCRNCQEQALHEVVDNGN